MKILYSAKWLDKFHGKFTTVEIHGQKHMFLKPQTFMNLSGKSVQAAKSFFKLADTEIIVVHDDIETEFGSVVFKEGGGFAGHNGLKSIADSIGSGSFRRLKLGIGRPKKGDVASFVLGRFTPEETSFIPGIIETAEEKLLEIPGF